VSISEPRKPEDPLFIVKIVGTSNPMKYRYNAKRLRPDLLAFQRGNTKKTRSVKNV
jgi:hypothetical protein